MGVTAGIVVLLTVAVGVLVLGFWSAPSGQRGDRRSAAVVTAHVLLAATTTLLWIAYLVSGSGGVGGVAVGAVLVTLALGLSSFASSRNRRPVPLLALAVHGVFALATVVLTVLAVARG